MISRMLLGFALTLSTLTIAEARPPGLVSYPPCNPAAPFSPCNETYAVIRESTGNRVVLTWDVYFNPAATKPEPVVLLIHPGGFKDGNRAQGSIVGVAQDLADHGYIACSIDYRLDLSFLPGQTVPASAPFIHAPDVQIDDVRRAISFARDPSRSSTLAGRVNHKVGAVGGSAGASHAAACAATFTTADNRFDAAVLLSGPYAFDDPASLLNGQFEGNVVLYCLGNPALLYAGSPVYQIDATCPPLYAFGTANDPITPTQLTDLQEQFDLEWLRAPDHQTQPLEGSAHAFDYWDQDFTSGRVTETVGEASMDWLASRLGLVP